MLTVHFNDKIRLSRLAEIFDWLDYMSEDKKFRLSLGDCIALRLQVSFSHFSLVYRLSSSKQNYVCIKQRRKIKCSLFALDFYVRQLC